MNSARLLTFVVAILVVMPFVAADDVALMVSNPDGSVYTECLTVDTNTDGYVTLESSALSLAWTDAGSNGHDLCQIDGTGPNPNGTSCLPSNSTWEMYLYDNGWKSFPATYDGSSTCWNGNYGSTAGHYCADSEDVIGLSMNGSNALQTPDFNSICQKLSFYDMDVTVGGKKDNDLSDGDKIRRDAKPEDKIEFKMRLENLYTKEEDVDIENVVVTVTIRDIDDGDDLEEETKEFDIRPEDRERETISFTIPTFVEEGTYDVMIEAEGDDINGRTHFAQMDLSLDVNKERHDIRIYHAEFFPPVLNCNDMSNLRVKIINFGEDVEDEVKFTVVSDELNLNIERADLELDADDPDDSVYEESFVVKRTSSMKPGTYYADISAYYGTTHLEDTLSVPLEVKDCGATEDEEYTTPKTDNSGKESNGEKETAKPSVETYVFTAPTTELTENSEESFFDTTAGIIVLVLLNLILIAGVVTLFGMLRK